MRTSRSVGAWRSVPWIAPVMIVGHDLGDLAHDVGVLGRGRTERAHHRRGHVGIARAATRFDRPSTARTRSAAVASVGGWRVRGTSADRLAARPSPRAAAAPSRRSSGRRCRARHRQPPRRRASAPRRSRRRRRGRASRRAPAGGAPPGCGPARPGSSVGGRRPRKVKHVSIFARNAGSRQCSRRMDLLRDARTACSRAICPSTTHHPLLDERASSPRCSRASRSSTRSPTRPRSTPTTGSSSSTRAACSTRRRVHETVRRGRPSRLDTAIFTHGHIDHVFGVELYEEEARDERVGAAARDRARAACRSASTATSSPRATTR